MNLLESLLLNKNVKIFKIYIMHLINFLYINFLRFLWNNGKGEFLDQQ